VGSADSMGDMSSAGGSGKTPVVLLHGWMMNRRCWDEVAARLQTMFDLHIAELPGHETHGETNNNARLLRIAEPPEHNTNKETGDTDARLPEHNANGETGNAGAKPPGHDAKNETNDASGRAFRIAEPPEHDANNGSVFSRPGELVAALAAAAPRRAVWVGWSLGGVLAQLAACRYPERVAGLVCIAAAARFVACDEWPHGMARAVFNDFAASFARDADAAAKRFLSLQTAGNGDAALLRRLRQAAARGGARTEQAHTGQAHAEHVHAERAHAGHTHTRHAHTEQVHAGQAHAKQVRVEQARAEHAHIEQVRTEHAHAEQAAALRFLGDSDLRGALRDCRCRADFIGAGRDRLVAARAVEQSSRLVRDGRFHHIADAAHAAPISHAERICEIIRQCAEHACTAT